MKRIGLIGLGEAGRTFAGSSGWRASTRAFDVKQLRHGSADEIRAVAAALNVRLASSMAEACQLADAVVSVVTASQALPVARQAAGNLAKGSLFLDLNSASPDTKRAAAAVVNAGGGRYVDIAVMSPVLPARLEVPLLVAGPHAREAAEVLRRIGFSSLRVVGDAVGSASAIKMIRSIMVKGLEALTAECFLAAEAAGVRSEVAASLDASWPGIDWSSKADYNLDRMIVHGQRRADEMDEVIATIEAMGLWSSMSRGTAAHQRALGRLGMTPPAGLTAKLSTLLSLVTDGAASGREAA